MNRKEIIPVIIVSTVLVLYGWLLLSGKDPRFPSILFLLLPFLLIWVVYSIIRHGKFVGKEMKEEEEWGYSDKDKNELGIF